MLVGESPVAHQTAGQGEEDKEHLTERGVRRVGAQSPPSLAPEEEGAQQEEETDEGDGHKQPDGKAGQRWAGLGGGGNWIFCWNRSRST